MSWHDGLTQREDPQTESEPWRPAPGKRTRTERLQRRGAPATGRAAERTTTSTAASARSPAAGAPSRDQCDVPFSADPDDPLAIADLGFRGAVSGLPFVDELACAFGPAHDLGGVRAYVGGPAAEACDRLGATAYTAGAQVAFRGTPDLHTAAHEATHVLQQQAGVHPTGGVGAEGDEHERQADAVADRVVTGRSAADLLAPLRGRRLDRSLQRRGGPPRGLWVGRVWLTPTSEPERFAAAELQGVVPYQRFRAAAVRGPEFVIDQFRRNLVVIEDHAVALEVANAYIVYVRGLTPTPTDDATSVLRVDERGATDLDRSQGRLDTVMRSSLERTLEDWQVADAAKRPVVTRLATEYSNWWFRNYAPPEDLDQWFPTDIDRFERWISSHEPQQVVDALYPCMDFRKTGRGNRVSDWTWTWAPIEDPLQILMDGVLDIAVEQTLDALHLSALNAKTTAEFGDEVFHTSVDLATSWMVDIISVEVPVVGQIDEGVHRVIAFLQLAFKVTELLAAVENATESPVVADVKRFLTACEPLPYEAYEPPTGISTALDHTGLGPTTGAGRY